MGHAGGDALGAFWSYHLGEKTQMIVVLIASARGVGALATYMLRNYAPCYVYSWLSIGLVVQAMQHLI